jgi:hypothetical protein
MELIMFNYKKSLCLGLISVAACTSVFATTVDFPVGQSGGTFNCTLSNSNAIVKIDTKHVDINGGCSGRPFVQADGHLDGVPADTFEGFYFQITKSLEDAGSVELTASTGDITCSLGHGDKKESYGDGKYCLK